MSPAEISGKRYIADLSLLMVTVIWGLSFTILKSVIGEKVSPVLFVAIRFFVASIVLFPVCAGRLKRLDRGGTLGAVLLGILIFLGFSSQSIGIQFTSASKSAFITGLSAVFVPLFLFVHLRKSPGIVNGLAIVVAVGGMYLLTDPGGGGFNCGDLLTLVCAIIFGAQIYVMGIVAPNRDFLSITFVELGTTTALAVILLPLESVKFDASVFSIAAVLFLGIVGTGVTLIVQTWAQQRTSSVKAGLIFTAEPVFAYMFASVLLDDYFNPVQKFGGALIVAAVISSEIIPALTKNR